jgi:hypothetical protein
MPILDPSKTADDIARLRQEIDRLREKQFKALKEATFVGMTPDEAKEFDERSKAIASILEKLMILQDPR